MIVKSFNAYISEIEIDTAPYYFIGRGIEKDFSDYEYTITVKGGGNECTFHTTSSDAALSTWEQPVIVTVETIEE